MPQVPHQNGPDWADIGILLTELGNTHRATIKMEVTTSGGAFGSSVRITAYATTPRFVGPAQFEELRLWAEYPSSQHRTIEGTIFNLLYRLDHRLASEWWKQARLPGDWTEGT